MRLDIRNTTKKGRTDCIHHLAILNPTNWDQLFFPVSDNFWSLSLALFTKDYHLMPSLTHCYSYRTEYIRAFIEVHHCKKYSTRVLLRISPGISEYCEFTVSFPAKNRKKIYHIIKNWQAILCIFVIICNCCSLTYISNYYYFFSDSRSIWRCQLTTRAIKYDLFWVSPFSRLGPLGFLTVTIESLSTWHFRGTDWNWKLPFCIPGQWSLPDFQTT